VWTWTAIDADSKMILSYLIGGRDAEYGLAFMDDLRSRLRHRVQLTTDGWRVYNNAVEEAFHGDVDYAQLVKHYGEPSKKPEARYSPPECIGAERRVMSGSPKTENISTSYVERSNLSMRMHMRRYTRLTNAHSKKFENHCHMVALYTLWYNFARINSAVKVSPAMAAGLTERLWDMSDIVALIDKAAPPPKPRGPYRQHVAAQ
jgi:IS1 family transposase